jgi:hypothetical protein
VKFTTAYEKGGIDTTNTPLASPGTTTTSSDRGEMKFGLAGVLMESGSPLGDSSSSPMAIDMPLNQIHKRIVVCDCVCVWGGGDAESNQ